MSREEPDPGVEREEPPHRDDPPPFGEWPEQFQRQWEAVLGSLGYDGGAGEMLPMLQLFVDSQRMIAASLGSYFQALSGRAPAPGPEAGSGVAARLDAIEARLDALEARAAADGEGGGAATGGEGADGGGEAAA